MEEMQHDYIHIALYMHGSMDQVVLGVYSDLSCPQFWD